MTSPLSEAVIAGADAVELASLPLPDHFPAACVRASDVDMFAGVEDKDVRKSLNLADVPIPELAPDEALIAVMASAINYNTVWTAMFEPLPTFQFLKEMGKTGRWEARHDLPYHIVGSDASGVIVRTGSSVRKWKVGDHISVSPAYVDEQDPDTHRDGMLGLGQKASGSNELRRSGSLCCRPGKSVDAEASSPHLGRSGCQPPVRQYGLPHAGRRPRCSDEAGRHRAGLGRDRRAGLLRRPTGAQRRRYPGRCGEFR